MTPTHYALIALAAWAVAQYFAGRWLGWMLRKHHIEELNRALGEAYEIQQAAQRRGDTRELHRGRMQAKAAMTALLEAEVRR